MWEFWHKCDGQENDEKNYSFINSAYEKAKINLRRMKKFKKANKFFKKEKDRKNKRSEVK